MSLVSKYIIKQVVKQKKYNFQKNWGIKNK